ncbi:DUF4167 domain-containing protein [Nitratireductor kimnyeongensis]|nr:DUF4167 domain-containing protein [Nitratireductor kimnyeongensis]
MRGRGNNNRKGPNPLARSYESNGPDVKIRGTAQQVADKYTTLARDAQSSGDRVMAENYLQHAEHYNRIIAAAQAQLQQQQQTRENRDDADDGDEQDAAEANNAGQKPQRQKRVDDGSGPQPDIQGVPAELALNGEDGGAGNGHAAGGMNGSADDEKPKPARRSRKPAAAKTEDAEGAQEGEKPAKRPRRTRARKSEDAEGGDGSGDGNETAPSASVPEEIAAQG